MPAAPDLGPRLELLGPYDLVSNRGKVVTYRARDRETREEVLAWVLKKHLARDEGVRTALAFGLDALSRLDHPGVMQVVDLRLSDDVVYFVKKTPGRTLSHWLRAGTVFTEADAVSIARSLLDALAHAHERGVQFGNIKPSNVVVDLDYREGSFRCRMRSLRGIDQEATFQTVRLAHPVTEGHVYLADEDGLPLVCLHPLVIVAECPKCDEHEMFFFESAGDERAHYFSFDHSHQLSEEALLAELVEHGYVAT